MKLLLLAVILMPIGNFLTFIAKDLIDSLVVTKRVQKKPVQAHTDSYTYKKAQ